jgi:hypothetical protein
MGFKLQLSRKLLEHLHDEREEDVWLWLERRLGGHVSIGPLTLHGFNAMHCALQLWTKRWGYITATPPLYWNGRWWPAHVYASPNATPWAATFMLGWFGDTSKEERVAAVWRRYHWGHNYDSERLDAHVINRAIDVVTLVLREEERCPEH